MSEQKEPVKIIKAVLAEQVEAGWKKPALAEHYGLPVSQMTQVLKDCGLKIRKFHAPKYVLVDEEPTDAGKTSVDFEGFDTVEGEDNLVAPQDEVQLDIVAEVASIHEENSTQNADW